MRYTKFASTAFLAAAATSIAAGTANAAPVEQAPAGQVAPQVQGQDRGVGYSVKLAEAGDAIVTQVTGGAFSLNADGKGVTLTNDAGQVVAEVPLLGQTAQAGAREVALTATIGEDGRQLALAPAASEVSGAQAISSQQWFFAELQRASLGAAVGAVIGGAIGLLGFIVSAVPGAIIGAGIGLLVAGGQPLIDSGIAYFSGQP
ncbi:hypothetical protein [Nocardia huaxiensis]|uniref:DUF8020 domain-containing protein n=1 Tax=Nocardia huaxiensis TaxID=2755382 RepID=A0A7D6V5F9_9NOCA|nr:hypothetical protein [Nocardia huaxiensis]QLY27901.1 hypothetical protein H0264_20935 [Nocardia huaxiensis]UFS98696.1 hypothetical protein LPY97_12760 [Nocardia huaxiensis]